MPREELLEPIISLIRRGTSLPRNEIVRYLDDWEVLPMRIAGEHVATAVVKGTEIHFTLVPGWRPRSCQRGAIREFLSPLFERHGFLTTRVRHERLAQKTFVQRVGFHPTWRDDQHEYYLLGRMPFERKT